MIRHVFQKGGHSFPSFQDLFRYRVHIVSIYCSDCSYKRDLSAFTQHFFTTVQFIPFWSVKYQSEKPMCRCTIGKLNDKYLSFMENSSLWTETS